MKLKYLSSRLKHRITLQHPVLTQDGAGGYTVEWQDIASLWAEFREINGREKFLNGKTESYATYILTIRKRDDITADMRVLYESRVFNIRAIAYPVENARNRMLLTIEEGVAV